MMLSYRSRAVLTALVVGVLLGPSLRARDDVAAEVDIQFADILADESRCQDAVPLYRRAREVADGRARFRASMGVVLCLIRTAEFRDARAEAAQLTAALPSNPLARALYGDALWAMGFFDEAEAEYRHAVSLSATESRARNGLAKALAARNLLDDALTEAQAAVALSPREPEFHHTLGYVLERQRRYDEAAVAMHSFLNLIPNNDRSEKALWTRQRVRFLESFKERRPLFVDPERDGQTYVVPFKLVRDKIMVRAKVNGREMDFVLDTGSEMTVVSERTAQRVNIRPIIYTLAAGVGQVGLRGLQVGRADTFEIGKLKVENVPTLIKNPPLRGLPTQEIESFSPLVLGFSMHIDYKRRLLTMGRALPPQTYDVELPLRHPRLAMVRGHVNGEHPVHFVVDTGGEVLTVSRATDDDLQMTPVRHIPVKVYGTSGWDPEAFLLTGVNLAFDRIRMPNNAVVVLNLDAPSLLLGFELGGIVGHRFLSRYDVSIDLQRSVLGLNGI
ncbi:MAG: aspartyl protease family protein [Vicinamibacterales bacterium]